MSVVFDYLQRRLAEQGSSYWKGNTFDIRLVDISGDIDPASMDISKSGLVEVSGTNYAKAKSSGNSVIQYDEGKIVYTMNDVSWVNSSVSCDGVLVSIDNYPLIFVNFGYKRMSEGGDFVIQWGENGLIYLEMSNTAVSGTSATVSQDYNYLTTGKSLGNGDVIYAGVSDGVIKFKTIVSDRWIVVSSTDDTIKLSLNKDFLVAGDNVVLARNDDGSVVIHSKAVAASAPVVVPDAVEKKIDDHLADGAVHVTQSEKNNWNTNTGDISGHTSNTSIHVTQTEKDKWNNNTGDISGHIGDNVIHVSQADRDRWNDSGLKEVSWDIIEDTPTTVSGYGITDVYTKTEIDVHTNNNVIHVNQTDRDRWNSVNNSYIYHVGGIGDTEIVLSHNLDTEDYEVSYTDMNTNSNICLNGEMNENSLVLSDLSPLVMNKQLRIVLRLLNVKQNDSGIV